MLPCRSQRLLPAEKSQLRLVTPEEIRFIFDAMNDDDDEDYEGFKRSETE